MVKTILQINEESRKIVKGKYPDAYYDAQFGGVFACIDGKDRVIAYGRTCNCAWAEAADSIQTQLTNRG
jgi:hypothetical protein